MDNEIKIIPQSKIQLAKDYKVSLKVFNLWIEPIKDELGEYRGKTFTPKQMRIIYDLLGHP